MTRISRWLPATTLTFGLAASGLVFIAPVHAQQVDPEPDTELLNETSEWHYLDDGNDPSNGHTSRTDWTTADFDDSAWQSAQGSFGATEGERTALEGGHTPNNLLDQYTEDGTQNKEAFFFRANFTVDADTIEGNTELNGSLLVDDAAIVYLNGERVAGVNDAGLELAEQGEDRNMVYSGSETAAPVQESITIDADVLQDGQNTIAVQLHQADADSSDVYFEMESLSLDTGAADDAEGTIEDDALDQETPAEENVDEQQHQLVEPSALVEGQEWSYLDDGTDPANGLTARTDWTDPAFDDSDWDTAAGSFGARSGELRDLSGGHLPDNLLDQYYPDTTDNKEAFFFRADFTVEATDIEDYVLNGSVRYDDAVTIFVNGQRIAGFHDDGLEFAEESEDRNMVFGGSNSGEPILEQFTVPADALETGENTIAVQLHQGREGSSDIYFDMESFDFDEAPLADSRTAWNYLDNGTDPSDGLENRTDWADPTFDDSAWPTSESGSFGSSSGEQASLDGGFYPDNLLAQHYDSGENKEAFFFRTNVNIASSELGENTVLRGSVRYDDAAIIYVNGQRVAGFDDSDLDFSEEGERRNMVFGGSNAGAPQRGDFVVPTGVLEAGENTIAVQIQQGRPASSDIYFGLESLDFDEFVPTNDGQTTIMLHMGADNSERRLAWVTDSQTPEGVELAAGAHDTMPEDAEVIDATAQDTYVEYGRDYVHATLSDLTEGTYSYRVGSDVGGWSDVEQFEVYPNDVEHEFTFIGDAQLGSSGNVANDGAGWQAALDANDALFPESQFVLSAGDQVETYAGRIDEYQAYINPQQMRTQASAATLGNHDYNGSPQALYGMHYNQPNMADYDHTEGSYWFMHSDVLHLNISTENRNWDDHREFLETTIEEHGDDAHWTMLTFHRPLYSAGNHSVTGTTNDIRDGLSPVINDLDIDVVLTGHDHSYSRSFLIDSEGNQVDPADSEAMVNAEGEVVETPEPTEGDEPNIGYDGRDSSPRLDEGNHIRVTPEAGDTLFVTANSSSGSKYYPLQDASNYRDGFEARFRDQAYEQNITGVEVDQCSITTNTVELDGTVVDKVELVRDNTEPTIRNIDNVTVTLGEDFDPRADIDVFDDCAELTADDVEVEGEVDVNALGEYTLTYSVVDAAGNPTSVERVVTVAEASEEPTEDPDPTETPEPTPTETPGNGNGDNDETPGAGGNGDENGESPSPQPTATDGAEPVADSSDRESGGLASTGASILTALAIGLAALVLGLMLFVIKRNRQNV